MANKKSFPADIPAPAAVRRAPRKRTSVAARPKNQNGSARHDPTHEEIAEAAYHKYLSRQGEGGSDFDDWVEAERELRSRSAAAKSQ
jgi:hypothetical protein